jgi:hypothetical protein
LFILEKYDIRFNIILEYVFISYSLVANCFAGGL